MADFDEISKKIDKLSDSFVKHLEDDRDDSTKHLELLGKISEQVFETQSCINKLDKKVDLSIQTLQYEIKAINELDRIQNAELERHIAGVKGVTDLVQSHRDEWSTRIETLEAPIKAKKMMVTWVIGSGKLAVAVLAVWKIIEAIPKILEVIK